MNKSVIFLPILIPLTFLFSQNISNSRTKDVSFASGYYAASVPQSSQNRNPIRIQSDTTLTFEDANDLPGITLGGNMQWKGVGGGHLYCETYSNDDFIYFDVPTFIQSWKMNGIPWEGYSGGSGFKQNIYAYDVNDNLIWNTQVDLTDYRGWDSWLLVTVNVNNVKTLKFEAPSAVGSGFWPSIDNLIIGPATPPFKPETKEELQTAVNLWESDNSSALEEYGAINMWDVSLITDMSNLFENKNIFNDNISSWDVSNVNNFAFAFSHAYNFNSDISEWDVSNVNNFANAFSHAYNFNSDISGWDVSNVTQMNGMLAFTESFNGNLSSWNVSNVSGMEGTFNGSAFNGDISNWNVSNVYSMASMFRSSNFNQDISDWNLENLVVIHSMFKDNPNFNQDISGWDISGVQESITNIFENAISFNQDISDWDVSNILYFQSLFKNATSFNQDISDWNMENATHMSDMFLNTDALSDNNKCAIQSTFSSNEIWPYDWNGNCYDFSTKAELQTAVNLWESDNSSSLEEYGAINTWDVSLVTDMSNLFSGSYNNRSTFNDEISNWDVSNVTNMSSMFAWADEFNGDLSSWDVSNVTNMNDMFISNVSFASDVSLWNVSSVVTFQNMFMYAENFNSDISGWDVSSATNMKQMFHVASSFNQDISNWDVSNVTNMNAMFWRASSFNQDISDWDVSNVTYFSNIFSEANSISEENRCLIANTWSTNQNFQAPAGFCDYPGVFIIDDLVVDDSFWSTETSPNASTNLGFVNNNLESFGADRSVLSLEYSVHNAEEYGGFSNIRHMHPNVANGGTYDWSSYNYIEFEYYVATPNSADLPVEFRVNLSDYNGIEENSYNGLGEYHYSFHNTILSEQSNSWQRVRIPLKGGGDDRGFTYTGWSGETNLNGALDLDKIAGITFEFSVPNSAQGQSSSGRVLLDNINLGFDSKTYTEVTFNIDMSKEDLKGQGVYVGGGDFGVFGQVGHRLNNSGNGLYSKIILIPSDTTFYFHYRIGLTDADWGGQWEEGESLVDGECGNPNQFGDRSIVVPDNLEPITIGAVCFASCYVCKNYEPTIAEIPDVYILEDSLMTVLVEGISSGNINEDQVLSLTAVTANQNVIDLTVNYTSPDSVATISFGYAADSSGTADVILTLKDNGGIDDGGVDSLITQFTVVVEPVNDIPTIEHITAVVDEDNSVIINFTGQDVEKDDLVFIIENNHERGSSEQLSDSSWLYSPNENFFGSDTLVYFAVDGEGDSKLKNIVITINPVNDYPIAFIAEYDVFEDESVSFQLEADDGDSFEAYQSGQTLTYILDFQSNHGSVDLDDDLGSATYSPNENFFGEDSFSFVVTDVGLTNGESVSLTDTAMVYIFVESINDQPVVETLIIEGAEDTELVLNFTGLDIENDDLNFIVENNHERGSTEQLSDSVWLYIPHDNFYGNDTLMYFAFDSEDDSEMRTVQISILPVNDKPKALNDVVEAQEDESILIQLNANDGDSFEQMSSNQPLKYFLVENTENSQVIIDSTTGEATYASIINFFGQDSFLFYVKDFGITGNSSVSMLDTAVIQMIVLPKNDSPIIASIEDLVINEDDSLSFVIDVIDVDNSDVGVNVSSADDNVMVYFENETLFIKPMMNWNGSSEITITANDFMDRAIDIESFMLTVNSVNDAPFLNMISYESIYSIIDSVFIDISGYDVDSETSFSTENAPSWLNMNNGLLSGYPVVDSTYNFDIIISDGVLSNSMEYTLTIRDYRPQIMSFTDVDNDQGGQMSLSWLPGNLGDWSYFSEFSIWRLSDSDDGNWDFISSVPWSGDDMYGMVVPTLGDSTSNGIVTTTFMITAHTDDPNLFFESIPIIGYSIDNIDLPAPVNVTSFQTPNGIQLNWVQEEASDLNYFSIYRSSNESFMVFEEALVSNTTNRYYFDENSDMTQVMYYQITSTDFSGNISEPSEIVTSNYRPNLEFILNQQIDEDGQLSLPFLGTDMNSEDSLYFNAYSDVESIFISTDDDSVYIDLAPNWNGIAEIFITLSDSQLVDTTSFTLTVNPVNDAPGNFSLLSPEDSTVVFITAASIDQDEVVNVNWENTTDVDGDDLSYGFKLFLGSHNDNSLLILDTLLPEAFSTVVTACHPVHIETGYNDNFFGVSPEFEDIINPGDILHISQGDQTYPFTVSYTTLVNNQYCVDEDGTYLTLYVYIEEYLSNTFSESLMIGSIVNLVQDNSYSLSHANLSTLMVLYNESYISCDWLVYATDGYDTTYSSGVNTLTLDARGVLSLDSDLIPNKLSLQQNYPNPFNPSTSIKYDLPKDMFVSIKVFDIQGRQVKELFNGLAKAGKKSIRWNGKNDANQSISAGTYIYVLKTNSNRIIKKMVFLK